MCITSKESSLAFATLICISMLLYIRNNKYDRIIAVLFIVISMVQFIELLYHTKNISSDNGGRALYVILLLQPLVLAIGLNNHFNSPSKAGQPRKNVSIRESRFKSFILVWLCIYFVIFLCGLIYSTTIPFSVTQEYGHLVWSKAGQNGIFDNTAVILLYLLGIFFPFFIIQYYENWRDIGIWILLFVMVLSSVIVKIVYPGVCFSSMWCYSSVSIIFTAWLIGAFDEHKNQ
jgi:hypothetical protein